tara:strand:+ start:304 stop:786 length:483 start_codon:yes stop_codon:yes gene_type:complete
MRVMPTLEGGLRIDVETATDWLVLEQIAPDALQGGSEKLPSRLSALMDDESEWDEMVIPELKEFFNGQLRKVADTVQAAQSKGDPEAESPEGEVFIEREDGLEWYGALNQARLALESRYQFGPAQEVSELEAFPAPKRSAFIRSQFYCALQSLLLEHVLE